MTHLVGRRLGRYSIEAEIGRGGMARVYRGMDLTLKRPVALKVLAPQLALDPEFARRFEREAQVAANLHHPNIVTIYDVGEQDELRYMAMELIQGRTLHRIIEEHGALGLGVSISIVAAIVSALDYAHSRGAVHRDVKPQNILIDQHGRVLLTDFGIAQTLEGDSNAERLTRTGVFMGTPEYISPEQATAQRVDGRSDLYSLGIATYEMISGHVPFSGATPQLIVAHVQTPPPPLTTLDPSLPAELDSVMSRILAKKPERRYQSGADFITALRSVAANHAIIPASPLQLAALATSRVAPPSESSNASTAIGDGQPPANAASGTPPLPPEPPDHTFQSDDSRHDPAAVVSDSPPTPPRNWRRFLPFLAGGVALIALFFLFQAVFANSTPIPTATATATPPISTAIPNTNTPQPTATATASPTQEPTQEPTQAPTQEPTAEPTQEPTVEPTIFIPPPPPFPTDTPIPFDTVEPTVEPQTPTFEIIPPTSEPSATEEATPTVEGETPTSEPSVEVPPETPIEVATETPVDVTAASEPTSEIIDVATPEPTIEVAATPEPSAAPSEPTPEPSAAPEAGA